jgi:hypothetical protein
LFCRDRFASPERNETRFSERFMVCYSLVLAVDRQREDADDDNPDDHPNPLSEGLDATTTFRFSLSWCEMLILCFPF